MRTITIVDVQAKYRTVEVPDSCPLCSAVLERAGGRRRPAVRELNLASSNFYGTFGPGDDTEFEVDTEAGEQRPSDSIWLVYGYECANCGELLAAGHLDVS